MDDDKLSAWPRYCDRHNYLLDKDGRCALCSLTNVDPARVKRGADYDRLPHTEETEGDPPDERDQHDADLDDEAWRSQR